VPTPLAGRRQADNPILRGEWIRKADGTEQVSASTGPTESYRYTENTDCSGTAQWLRPQDNGGEERLPFSWNSVKNNDFQLTYEHCKENDLGVESCKTGWF